jgi:hypothetical protein
MDVFDLSLLQCWQRLKDVNGGVKVSQVVGQKCKS